VSARLLIVAPIPDPASWVISPELPPGHFILRSLTISRREPAKIRGTDLVPREDIAAEAVPPLLERLLAAYAALDEGGRLEVVRHAEQLAGTTP